MARSMDSMFLGGGVFLLCLLGILSRPHVDLATFWPANALMLGMLVRFPRLASPMSWIACALGFFMADAITGAELTANLVLNGGNLLAIAAGYRMLMAMPARDRALRRPVSILYLMRALLVASFTAGVTGMVADPLLFGGTWLQGFCFWAATEMVNYTAFLPMILTLPRIRRIDFSAMARRIAAFRPRRALPLLALAASAAAGAMIGGPGAVAFPVPALLWCALSYNLFVTACLSFAFGAWTLLAIRMGFLWVGDDFGARSTLISARMGVTLVALAPLVVSSAMAARNELLERMRILAEHDAMTGLRNRRSFFELGEATLKASLDQARPTATMMLDIDHFKAINDNFGHEAGDRVLIEFARVLEKNLRAQDIAGRIGGEEFAVVLPDCTMKQVIAIAGRINAVVHAMEILLEGGTVITMTVSIGIHLADAESDLHHLIAQADKALYQAKNTGRDRFEVLPIAA